MLPRDSLGLPPVLRPSAASAVEALGDPRQQAFQRALAGQLGKSMQGQVLGRLADGSALVRVADTVARMPLPPGAELGSEVPLKLVALHPRPTFEMGSGASAALVEASPAPALADAAEAPPAAAPAEEAAVFTPHGDSPPLLYRPDGRSPAPAALPAESGATPTPGAPAAGAAAAGGPATTTAAAAVTASSLPAPPGAAALAEHGASLSAAGQVLGSVMAAVLRLGQPARTVAGRIPALPAPSADAAVLAPALRQALEQSGLFYESHVAAWANGERDLAALAAEPQMQARPATPTEDGAAQLINLQLAAHEHDRVAWEGQLWPGQPLRWEIERDPRQPARDGGGEQPAVWQSRLRLHFPLLGELDATVALHGDKVAVRVAAGDSNGAALLKAHADALVDAMAGAGTPLSALVITAQAPDE